MMSITGNEVYCECGAIIERPAQFCAACDPDKPEMVDCPNCRGTGFVFVGGCMIDDACEECENGKVEA